MLSFTEENYLKALVQIGFQSSSTQGIGTNELATYLNVKPATVNDMLKKLREKQLVSYEKYGKITLSADGRRAGMMVIRKHRLWETFLVEKLNFSWDEVHEVAEQLEHIQSTKLVESLDALLDHPRFDPHGDAIPDGNGEILIPFRLLLSELPVGTKCKVAGVKDNSAEFLQYVDRLGAGIGAEIQVIGIEKYDGLTTIGTERGETVVSNKFTSNVYVVCQKCNVGKDCNQQDCNFRIQGII
jgi:DtxR family transcriptional regulator, Mn-dependent transcriptional regulator